eukprot:TRINITY_DN50062_c0_g1_i1.p2 TRINITY_DN50062_c0_g1~~TRINITY_DN50062_c0_g1_i1.p2  ORF type:complete len:133 (-),score=8.91 TRINITY_DN50062_c0_g1_i1:97-495(-)
MADHEPIPYPVTQVPPVWALPESKHTAFPYLLWPERWPALYRPGSGVRRTHKSLHRRDYLNHKQTGGAFQGKPEAPAYTLEGWRPPVQWPIPVPPPVDQYEIMYAQVPAPAPTVVPQTVYAAPPFYPGYGVY